MTYTPSKILNAIGVINQLRQHPETKAIYATIDGEAYTEYLHWYKEWIAICENPVRFEECSIRDDRFELDFTLYPSEPVRRLIEMYLTLTCNWKEVTFERTFNGTMTMVIGA